ncbi:MAG: hypothetical protein AAF322_02725 [Pseudomonadota bacterium]
MDRMLRPLSRFAPVAAGLCAAAFWCGGAVAGAWTQEPGVGFASQTFRYFETTTGAPFQRASFTAYVEYGLLDRLTIGGELDQGARLDEAAQGAQNGRAAAFVRGRLWKDDEGNVASVQIGGSTPLSGFVSPAAPGGDDADEVEGRLMVGRGFAGDWGSGWAEAAFGLSHFTGSRADEASVDLTAGFRPDEDWVALAQVFATYGLRNEAFGGTDFDAVKLQVSVGRKLFGERTFLLSVARDVHTRGTSAGFEVSLSIWSSF